MSNTPSNFPRGLGSGFIALCFSVLSATVASQETLRKEIAQPLQAAQASLSQGKAKEALAQLTDLAPIAKEPREVFWVQSLRAQAAERAGEFPAATTSYKSALENGQPTAVELATLLRAAAPAALRARDFGAAASWAARWRKEAAPAQGGAARSPDDARAMRQVEVRALFQSNQHAAVPEVMAIEPLLTDEASMSILAASYVKLGNESGYVAALEGLLLYHAKPNYWVDRLSRLQTQPGFARGLGLELYRLQLAVGALTDPAEYLEMAQMSQRATYPAEAEAVLSQGLKAGHLKSTDANVSALMERLKSQVSEDKVSLEQTAKAATGVSALTRNGWALASIGQANAGIPLLERAAQGASPGTLDSTVATLRLAQSLVIAGQADKAAEVLRQIGGTDGAADLARLWRIHLKRL